MCADSALAPADVPPTVTPARCASCRAAPKRVPLTTADSLSWLPPVMNTPSAPSSARAYAGSSASAREVGLASTTSPAPSRVKVAR